MIFVTTLVSCTTTKFVPEGSYLLDEVKIHTDNKAVRPSDLKPYLRQVPNPKWFSTVKTPLYIYNLSGRDSTKWFNKFLREIGDAPEIYDVASAERSQQEITRAMQNLGYIGASVERVEKKKKKKLKLTYQVTSGNPYIISSIAYYIQDPVIEEYLTQVEETSSIKEGMLFDINVLETERQRITDYLLRNGFYKFNKNYITYVADTVENTYRVDVTMQLNLFRNAPTDSLQMHPQYRIRKISYVTDYDALYSSGLDNILTDDSMHYRGRPVYYKEKLYIRPKVLMDNTRIRPGGLYNERGIQSTYNYFGRLQAFKYTNIRFSEVQIQDSLFLDTYILLTRNKRQTVGVELEGTNSAGDLGAAVSTTYSNRNLFKGSEVFTLKLRTAYEAITAGSNYSNNNYFELAAEASLNFPNFLFPFLSSGFKRSIRANSELGIQYNHQIRPEYTRTIASGSWSYKWAYRQRSNHRFDLVDLNFVYMPWISSEFQNTYLGEGSVNSILKYNYENLLIMKMGYSYTFNSASRSLFMSNQPTNSYSVRFNIESAGNLLYAFSRIANKEKNNDYFKILNIRYAQYIKGDFDFARNIAIDDRNSFSLHFATGIAVPYGNADQLPFEKRYFSGGANSVRGWSVRTLGPGTYQGEKERINFMIQSGDIKLDASVEYRTKLFWKLRGAAFIDAGNIWTIRNYTDQPGGVFRINRFYKEIAVSYGLGVRFDFDFFILRFDGGMKAIDPAYKGRNRYPLIHPRFERDFAFYFAVGYPF
ncbi:MAG: sorting and assembly machinery component 50 [Bacteroides sp.]|nr:sorting and assembly machinery component 50 [Bacteroides sp.]